ncbi:MAG: hydroxymethylglutaryl-CoA synthase [Candidatus Methanomethylophilaceae archaeon]|nr:hydroxymethylglutaryl-CoA synthase [Candidatus Methanomethylophilaceae archaeon]MDI3542086.1 hydroxymethylglutaryl-CoA synthase [Candidatus Methanomethylophilaceae archaeon]
MEVGIVSYGAYIPRFRITPIEIGRVWGQDGKAMAKGLYINSKSVPSPDEDVVTIAIAAARSMMRRVDIDPADIGALYVGSESHPYAVKPSGTVVAEAIEASPLISVADLEFACKAGTAGMQAVMGQVGSGMIRYGVAIGADTSQGAPGDALEYSASAGGAAFLIGSENIIARINSTLSYTTDTPDFWRREGQPYPSHGGRFTGEPAYFKHVGEAAKMMMERMGTSPADYNHVIFHQPNGKFPQRMAKMLGFTDEQLSRGLLTPMIGNTYSGAVPLGLASVLDTASPGDRILMVAYGSGAGSDAFDITVTDTIRHFNLAAAPTVASMLENTREIDYATYAKYRGKILMKG